MFAVLTTLIVITHGYLGWRHINGSGLTGTARLAAWAFVVAFGLLLPITFSSRFWLTGGAADVLSWIGYIAMGIFSFVFVLTVLRDLGWLVARVTSTLPADPERRTMLLRMTNAAVLGTSGVLTAVGVAGARRRAAILDVVVPVVGLPPSLEGFTIAQITDVHVGPTIKKDYIEAIVEGVNSIGADMVAVTGDVVDGSVADLGQHIAPFAQLKGKHGVFFCTGNHEYYSGADEWVAELTRLGLRCLMNEHVVVEHNGARVVVGGVTDFNAEHVLPAHTSDANKAMRGAPTDAAYKIVLAHQPRSCDAAAAAGFDLQLSGHTHGGQFLPWNFFVKLQQPFVAGLDRFKDMWVYTSRGTGYWGPPVRVGAPSEITRLVLKRA
ncbi:MAG TPA: metallophosphoesterase [Myxococcota bacterium]